MTDTKTAIAGERTHEQGCMGNYDYRDCTCGPSTIDPIYGFLNSLRDCTFHFDEGQHELTIKAPDGGKIGLPFVDEMRAMTAPRDERNARMSALALLEIVRILDHWQQGSDSINFGALVGKEDGDTLGKLVTDALAKVRG